jgi:hypothetical protein
MRGNQTNLLILFFLFLASSVCPGDNPFASFVPGKGSRFHLDTGGTTSDLMIYVTESTPERLHIEYFFATSNLGTPVELWQQFALVPKGGGGGFQLAEGFLFAPELNAPERLEASQLNGFDGLEMNDFLFSSAEELNRFKVGEEVVTAEAGTVKATHYRQTRNGDTLDYWISDEAKPIGLVKLTSVNPQNASHNYSLSLAAKLSHVGRKIDPAKAVPLTEKGRALLSLPTTSDKPSVRANP